MIVASRQSASISNTQNYTVCSGNYRQGPKVGKPSTGTRDSPRKAKMHPGIKQPESMMRAIQEVTDNCFDDGGRKGRHKAN